ncbi:MAG: selenobiotic family peptide radical SAM maturase [Elusimicrobia bacterium]|nr:selenobiotic family peptide radical SAM maturase [Elusimicrobiota bacterium]
MLRDRWLFGRAADVFTLQWHLTNACELSCVHCYDRSERRALGATDAFAVLDQLDDFCRARGVGAHACFTGGNPLLYPRFFDLYEEAAARGMRLSVLGNPVRRSLVERLAGIRRPVYYQVSLEGLEEHNDRARGRGHFDRTLRFLDVLREARIGSCVMLTVTRDNLHEVLPLAEALRGRADRFTFNRLSRVGEGAALELPDRRDYVGLLRDWTRLSHTRRGLGFKDGLFNLLRRRHGRPLTGGCTGHGCGAAFNFLALLPDGELHACRKFPSRVGHVFDGGLAAAYDSPAAGAYRRGSAACEGCGLRRRCGGCLAVTYGCGLDPLAARDPFCFKDEADRV